MSDKRGITMFEINSHKDSQENYQALYVAIQSHMKDEDDLIANLANISSFIYWTLEDINWSGFYLMKNKELVLGPFCGKPACTRISVGKGVCGTAVYQERIIVVPDVHNFDGHIACDGETKSEIVLPIFKGGKVFGVLDIDSPIANRFSELDKEYLAKIAECISSFVNKSDNQKR